jgi:hypothetical protein
LSGKVGASTIEKAMLDRLVFVILFLLGKLGIFHFLDKAWLDMSQ